MGLTKEKAFPKPLRADKIGPQIWKLVLSFIYDNPPDRVVVPVGFISDGASIPRIAQSLIGGPWSGRYSESAVIHDYLYETMPITKRKADRIFLDGMKILGVIWWRRNLMYLAVRANIKKARNWGK